MKYFFITVQIGRGVGEKVEVAIRGQNPLSAYLDWKHGGGYINTVLLHSMEIKKEQYDNEAKG